MIDEEILNDREIAKELQGLKGDIRMKELAVQTAVENNAKEIKEGLGEQIRKALSGEIQIEIKKTKKDKFKDKIKNFFKRFEIGGKEC